MVQGTRTSYTQEKLMKHKEQLKNLAIMFKGNGLYDSAQRYLTFQGISASKGSISKFYKVNFPKFVNTDRVEYGSGENVKVGRTARDKFTCKTTSETYVRLAEKWVREYCSMMTDVLREENNQNMVVHHIDGNHLNNDKKNLKIMSREEHSRLHCKLYWKRVKEQQNKESAQ